MPNENDIEEFTDEEGKKFKTKISAKLTAILHTDATQKYKDEELKPAQEKGRLHREAEEKATKIDKEFQKWKEEKFGK